jgi:hypothetical protein
MLAALISQPANLLFECLRIRFREDIQNFR